MKEKNRKLISRTKERKNKLSQEMNSFFLKQENIVVIFLVTYSIDFFKRYFVKFKNRKLIATKLRFWKEYVCLFVCLFVCLEKILRILEECSRSLTIMVLIKKE